VALGEMGLGECGMMVGSGLWCVGGVSEYGKNDGSTHSTTYAGAIWPYFFKMVKNVHLGQMDIFLHLENLSMIFTDSYLGGVHLGDIDVFDHLSVM
jgi:hypothetical protein